MRLSGGQFGGRNLICPSGDGTRPTTDRAREGIFNILSHADWAPAFEESRVLDLFAGSGALGFEALSRGAEFCLFVETAAGARAAIRDNIDNLGLYGHTRIHRRSATALGSKPPSAGPKFNLVFLDPPYAKGLAELALTEIMTHEWIAQKALIVVECSKDETPDTGQLTLLDERCYGAARVLFLIQ